MGYVFHVLVALALVAAAGAGAGAPWLPAGATIVLMPLPYVLARLARRFAWHGRRGAALAMARAFEAAPLVAHALTLLVTAWPEYAERFRVHRFGDWPGPELLVGLAPYAAFELLAIDARARALADGGGVGPRGRAEVRDARSYHGRMLASAFAPLVLFLAMAWPLAFVEPWRVHVEEVALLGLAHVLVVLLVIGLALPFVVRFTWDTTPLPDGAARRMLVDLAARARFRCRQLLLWRTGGQVANAAIVGFTPGTRHVLFSDALLARLAPRELAAVFAHEVGHATRRHLVVFLVFTLGVFAAVDLGVAGVSALTAPAAPVGDTVGRAGGMLADDVPFALAAAAVGFALWYVAFGWLSRRFELDADLVALELTGDAGALTSALGNVAGLHARTRPSWRHFSVSQRVVFLRASARDAAVGLRLRRSLRAFTLAIVVGAVLTVGFDGWRLAAGMDEQRAAAELRLGRYSAAASRLEAAGRGEGRGARLARAGALVGDGAGVPELARAAAAARRAGDDALAGLYDELVAWREVGVSAAAAAATLPEGAR